MGVILLASYHPSAIISKRIRPAISPPAATSGVFEDGWRRVHPGKKRGGVFCPFGSRLSTKLGEGI
jgi:hypothetical protein